MVVAAVVVVMVRSAVAPRDSLRAPKESGVGSGVAWACGFGHVMSNPRQHKDSWRINEVSVCSGLVGKAVRLAGQTHRARVV